MSCIKNLFQNNSTYFNYNDPRSRIISLYSALCGSRTVNPVNFHSRWWTVLGWVSSTVANDRQLPGKRISRRNHHHRHYRPSAPHFPGGMSYHHHHSWPLSSYCEWQRENWWACANFSCVSAPSSKRRRMRGRRPMSAKCPFSASCHYRNHPAHHRWAAVGNLVSLNRSVR